MDSTITALLASGKGILAADESFPTIEKRFNALGIPSTEEARLAYRELLFTTPRLNEFISGVILFDETIRQRTQGGVPIPELLARQGIIPGIKVDRGTISLANFPGEKITEGLDGLGPRLIEYRKLGARFTKWRAVFEIGEGIPTAPCLEANARALALFAGLCQDAGLVPIVEPEVLMEGSHDIARTEEIVSLALKCVFDALFDHRVVLERILLKTGMILSGAECPEQAGLGTVAAVTRRCLLRAVPAAVPGIVFLSGGQNDEIATQRLNAICRAGPFPWKLSFSFGRALQTPALNIWRGSPANAAAAQAALHLSAQRNSLALRGEASDS